MQCLCVFKVSGHLGVVEHLEMEGIYAIYMNSITEYTRSVRNGSSRSNIKSIIEWPANNFEICHQRMQHDFVYSCQFQLQVQLKWNIIFTLKNNSAYVKKKICQPYKTSHVTSKNRKYSSPVASRVYSD